MKNQSEIFIDAVSSKNELDLFNAEGVLLLTTLSGIEQANAAKEMERQYEKSLNKPKRSPKEKLHLLYLSLNLAFYTFHQQTFNPEIYQQLESLYDEICNQHFLNNSQKAKWGFVIGHTYQLVEHYAFSIDFLEMAIKYEEMQATDSEALKKYYLTLIKLHIHYGIDHSQSAPDIEHHAFVSALQLSIKFLQRPAIKVCSEIYSLQAKAYFFLSQTYAKRQQPKMQVNTLFAAISAGIKSIKMAESLEEKQEFLTTIKQWHHACQSILDANLELSSQIPRIKPKFTQLDTLLATFDSQPKQSISQIGQVIRELNTFSLFNPNILGFWLYVLAGLPLETNEEFFQGSKIIFITDFAGKKDHKRFITQLDELYKELKDKPEKTQEERLLILAIAANLEINNFKILKRTYSPLWQRDNYFNYSLQMVKYYDVMGSTLLKKEYKPNWYTAIGDVFATAKNFSRAITCYRDAIDFENQDDNELIKILKLFHFLSLLTKNIITRFIKDTRIKSIFEKKLLPYDSVLEILNLFHENSSTKNLNDFVSKLTISNNQLTHQYFEIISLTLILPIILKSVSYSRRGRDEVLAELENVEKIISQGTLKMVFFRLLPHYKPRKRTLFLNYILESILSDPEHTSFNSKEIQKLEQNKFPTLFELSALAYKKSLMSSHNPERKQLKNTLLCFSSLTLHSLDSTNESLLLKSLSLLLKSKLARKVDNTNKHKSRYLKHEQSRLLAHQFKFSFSNYAAIKYAANVITTSLEMIFEHNEFGKRHTTVLFFLADIASIDLTEAQFREHSLRSLHKINKQHNYSKTEAIPFLNEAFVSLYCILKKFDAFFSTTFSVFIKDLNDSYKDHYKDLVFRMLRFHLRYLEESLDVKPINNERKIQFFSHGLGETQNKASTYFQEEHGKDEENAQGNDRHIDEAEIESFKL